MSYCKYKQNIMNCKIKIDSAYPQVRMLERKNSFAYEVWAWKVRYTLIPTDSGCGCHARSGEVMLSLHGLAYAKATLAKEVRAALDIQ